MAVRRHAQSRADLGADPGSRVSGPAVVRSRKKGITKKGRRPYLKIELAAGATRIVTMVWEESIPAWDGIQPGTAVFVEGTVGEPRNGYPPSLDLSTVRRLPDSHPVRGDVNPRSRISREELGTRLAALIGMIEDSDCRKVIDCLFDRIWDAFLDAPAAKTNHHAWIGGLAEHTIEVTQVALSNAEDLMGLQDRVHMDSLVAGAIAHDCAKVEEYEFGDLVPIDFSADGRLNYHTVRGAEMLGEALRSAYEVGPRLAQVLRHIQHTVISHHGIPEHGSPVPPRTLEALLVHHADLASSRLSAAREALEGDIGEDGWADPPGWRRSPIWDYRGQLPSPEPSAAEHRTDVISLPLPIEPKDQFHG